MTKEEAIKVLDQVRQWTDYPKEAFTMAIDALSQPSPPSDLEEAAKEYAKTTFKKPYSDNPDEEVTIVEPDKYAGFIAGAKWDREQMMSEAVEGDYDKYPAAIYLSVPLPRMNNGDKVRVIVLPKED